VSTSSVSGATGAAATTASSGTTVSSKIDGLVSGLDTTAIINAIMAQAALPQTNLKNQLASEQAVLAAYQSINTKMVTLQTASDALTLPSTWQAMVTQSSSASVSATATTGAQASAFTFDVTQLAAAQSSVFANAVSSTSANVVTAGTPVTISVGAGSPVTIDTGDGSLGAVVAGINQSGAGVQAAAVQVAPGQYRLQLTSATTGAASAFTVSGLDSGPLGALSNTATARDAQVTVGAGTPGSYTISSSSNTFNQALPGVTFTVSQLATGVTLSTTSDSTGLADNVQAMVDAANAVLTEIGNDTAYNTQTHAASILTGDFTARQLQNNILSSVSSALGNGTSAASIGISVSKDGQVTFDSAAFKAAFAANPAAVQSAFVSSGSFAPAQSGLTGSITLQKGSDATQAGAYAVTVTQAATKASATIDTSALAAGDTITLGSNGSTATYTVQAGDTQQNVVDALNALAATKQLTVAATIGTGNTINLSSSGYGSEYTFTAAATGGLVASPVTAGLDVAGTINGTQAQGIGQFLFTNTGTPGVDALSLQVTLTPADVSALGAGGNAGTFTYATGAGQRLAGVAYAAVATKTGLLTGEINGANDMITSLNTQIASWQVVLDSKQAALQTVWTNLETQLSNLKAQSSQLTAAIGSLPNSSTSSSSGG
jgi:flagellar hook-associated protein 2